MDGLAGGSLRTSIEPGSAHDLPGTYRVKRSRRRCRRRRRRKQRRRKRKRISRRRSVLVLNGFPPALRFTTNCSGKKYAMEMEPPSDAARHAVTGNVGASIQAKA
jgi:hypothetical protein